MVLIRSSALRSCSGCCKSAGMAVGARGPCSFSISGSSRSSNVVMSSGPGIRVGVGPVELAGGKTPRSRRRAFWVMASSMRSRRCMSRPSSENCIDRSAPDGRSNSRPTGAAPLNSQSTIPFPSRSIAAAAAGVRSMPARLVRSSDSARGRAPVSQYLSSGPRALGYQGPTSTMSQRIDLSPLKTRTLGRGPENRQGSATPGRLGQPQAHPHKQQIARPPPRRIRLR